MPELPEVETTKNKIATYLEGQYIEKIIVRQAQLRTLVAPEILALKHQKVVALSRRAKYIIVQLSRSYILIHLGMTGFFKICQSSPDSPAESPTKHDHIDVVLADGIILRYNDVRRFGAWHWVVRLEDSCLLQALGVEPLSDAFNADYLASRLKSKKAAIKIALMDNKIVVGVGNIYASESLFLAEIHPSAPALSLAYESIERLVLSIKAVLYRALEVGGTSIRDFRQPDGKLGYFSQELKVYGRKGQTCYQCGAAIESMIIGQRNSFFCPKCQKNRVQVAL